MRSHLAFLSRGASRIPFLPLSSERSLCCVRLLRWKYGMSWGLAARLRRAPTHLPPALSLRSFVASAEPSGVRLCRESRCEVVFVSSHTLVTVCGCTAGGVHNTARASAVAERWGAFYISPPVTKLHGAEAPTGALTPQLAPRLLAVLGARGHCNTVLAASACTLYPLLAAEAPSDGRALCVRQRSPGCAGAAPGCPTACCGGSSACARCCAWSPARRASGRRAARPRTRRCPRAPASSFPRRSRRPRPRSPAAPRVRMPGLPARTMPRCSLPRSPRS